MMAIKKKDISTQQNSDAELALLPNMHTLPSMTIDSNAASGCVSSFDTVDEHGTPMPPAAIALQNVHQLTSNVVDEVAKVKNIMKEERNGSQERSSLVSPKESNLQSAPIQKDEVLTGQANVIGFQSTSEIPNLAVQGHLKLEPFAGKSELLSSTRTEDAVAERPWLENILPPPLVNRPSLRNLHDQHLVENFLRQAEARASQTPACQKPGIRNQVETPISPLVRQPSLKQLHSMHLVSGMEEGMEFTESISIQVELVLAMEMSEIAGKETQVSSNQR